MNSGFIASKGVSARLAPWRWMSFLALLALGSEATANAAELPQPAAPRPPPSAVESGGAAPAPTNAVPAHAGGSRPAADMNLILISLTNTRADHLGMYGYERPTSPNLDRLARKSLVFRNAFSHASWTLPAVMSLFTSQHPFTHGLMDRQDAQVLPPETPTLVDVLKARGYVSAAFVGNRDYSPKYGHTSRFDWVFEPIHDDDAADWRNYGVLQNVLPPARDWLKQHRDRKFFLLVQGYDTHCPFALPRANPKFSPQYQGDIDFSRCYWTFARSPAVRIRTPTGRYEEAFLLKTKPADGDDYEVLFSQEDIEQMIALYDGEILNADAQLGALLQDLTDLGLEKKTVVVFYSDHGDMFGKHGRFMRGGPLRGTFYDDVLHIPLIVYHPGFAHRDVNALVQLIDLAPTLLELLGGEVPASFHGKSCVPAFTGEAPINEYVYAGAAFTPSARNPFFRHSSVITSVRSREWKLIRERLAYSVGTEEQFELYDLRRDPQELRDVAAQQPEVLARMKAELHRWFETVKTEKRKLP